MRGRLSIAPTQGIVIVEVVVGHGTGIAGTLAVPPRRCAASLVELPRLCAGLGTPPLRLCAVGVLAGGVPRSPAHDVSDWAAVDGAVDVCNVEDWVGSDPSPVVPSAVVPRPLVPRAVTPRLAVLGELLAVAVAELPDDTDEGIEKEFALGAVVAAEFGAVTTPELLTELHGADVLAPAAGLPGSPDAAELVERLNPAPSKVGSTAVPGFPMEHGAGLTVPE